MAPSYRFGKGPIVVALETTLRDPLKFDELYDDIVRTLDQIGDGQPTTTSNFKKSLDGEARNHLDKDVFGTGQADPAAVEQGAQRRRVYYEALKRAMELARTLGRPGDPAPIEVFWGCGQPRNECWISWDKAGRPGVALFVLSTDPAIADGGAPGDPDPGFPGPDPGDKGMYVVRAPDAQGNAVFRAKAIIGV